MVPSLDDPIREFVMLPFPKPMQIPESVIEVHSNATGQNHSIRAALALLARASDEASSPSNPAIEAA